jgi:hypothetical protein
MKILIMQFEEYKYMSYIVLYKSTTYSKPLSNVRLGASRMELWVNL